LAARATLKRGYDCSGRTKRGARLIQHLLRSGAHLLGPGRGLGRHQLVDPPKLLQDLLAAARLEVPERVLPLLGQP
jgi:hypothetical protein